MKAKKTAAKKSTKKHAAVPAEFFVTGKRGIRNVERKQFHVLLTLAERKKLARLTRSMKLNAADVVRTLISEASAGY